MNKAIAHKYDCEISNIGVVFAEETRINNSAGTIDITFCRQNPSDNVEVRFKCHFKSYSAVRILVEDCDLYQTADNLPKQQNYLSFFGNVVIFEQSDFIEQYENTTEYIHNKQEKPKHFSIYAVEDIIEVLTYDNPVFTKSDS